jgi:hypothetical protein
MEDHLNAANRPQRRRKVPDVAIDHLQAGVAPAESEVLLTARRKIVEDPDPVTVPEEALHHVGADEPGAACHDKHTRIIDEGREVGGEKVQAPA